MLVVWILLFLILSAMFSGSEIAFISASKVGIELKKQKGDKKGSYLSRIYERPDRFLGTMLVGNNIALVILTILMTTFLEPYFSFINNEVLLLLTITLVITIVVLVFGEYLPKTFFRLKADKVLFILAYPLRFFQWLLAIPTAIMTWLSSFMIRKVLKTPIEETEYVLTRLDLETYIESSLPQTEEEIEKDIFSNALHLEGTKVRACMVPRTEIAYIDVTTPLSQIIDMIEETQHSRLLVSDRDIDNVLGYIHHQQIISGFKTVKEAILEIDFVPEVMSVKSLMTKFIKEGTKIACVVDEFGGTAGVITLEDMLEEIFGEIEDEHDQEDLIAEKISDNEYRFSGRIELDLIREKFPELKFPDEDFETLSGYLVMTIGSIPDEGDELELNGYQYIIEAESENRIDIVRLRVGMESDNQ